MTNKQTAKKNERRRFRKYLRKHTHWRNPSEFFTAILFEAGAPPHPLRQRHPDARAWDDLVKWRNETAVVMNARLHHWINPTPVMEAYILWLIRQQESNRISRL